MSELQKYYDKAGMEQWEGYQKFSQLNRWLNTRPIQNFINRVISSELPNCNSVIDLGCGMIPYFTQEKYRGVGKILLIDFSNVMLQRAQEIIRKKLPDIEIETLHLDLLEIADKEIPKANLIICSGLLEHFTSDQRNNLLQQVAKSRCDKVILTYAQSGFLLKKNVGKVLRNQGLPYVIHSPDEIRATMEESGYVEMKIKFSGKVPLLSPICVQVFVLKQE